MIYKIIITLKNSGKTLETFVEKGNIDETCDAVQKKDDKEWLKIAGFNGHPLRVPKTLLVRSEEIGGVEIMQADDWFVAKAEEFKDSLESRKKTDG